MRACLLGINPAINILYIFLNNSIQMDIISYLISNVFEMVSLWLSEIMKRKVTI